MTDAWRPFEPCRENVREARLNVPSLYERLLAREVESFRPNPYVVQYPRLKSARLIPHDAFTVSPYSSGFYFKRPYIAFRVPPTGGNPGNWDPTQRALVLDNHDRGDEDRS